MSSVTARADSRGRRLTKRRACVSQLGRQAWTRAKAAKGVEILRELACARVTLRCLLLEAAQQDRGQISGKAPGRPCWVGGLLAADRVEDRLRRFAGKGPFADEEFVEGRAEREHVAGRTELARLAVGLLRAHVMRRAGEVARARCRRTFVVPREAEVGEDHAAVTAKNEVGGLEIAVHDARFVHVGQGARDLIRNGGQGLDVAAAPVPRGVA
jgi:hypothetical protein